MTEKAKLSANRKMCVQFLSGKMSALNHIKERYATVTIVNATAMRLQTERLRESH